MSQGPLLTIPAAANAAGVDRRTIERALKLGQIPCVRLAGLRRIPRKAIEKLLQASE